MKIKYLPLLLILLLAFACKRQQQIIITPDYEKNHRQRNHILGEAKTVTSFSYIIPEEEEDTDTTFSNKILYAKTIQHYSPDGYLTSVINFNENNDTVSIRKIYYFGNAKQNYWILTTKAGKVIDSCQYEYDYSGFLSSEKRFSNDSLYYQIRYKTDALGNVIELFLDNGEFVLRNTLQYDLNGLLIRTNEYSPDNKLFKFSTIEYDNYGDEVNRRVFKRENDIIEYTYTQYDERGKLLGKIFEDRLRNFREDFKYYHHDKQGNWTTEHRIIGNKVKYIRERNINYY